MPRAADIEREHKMEIFGDVAFVIWIGAALLASCVPWIA